MAEKCRLTGVLGRLRLCTICVQKPVKAGDAGGDSFWRAMVVPTWLAWLWMIDPRCSHGLDTGFAQDLRIQTLPDIRNLLPHNKVQFYGFFNLLN